MSATPAWRARLLRTPGIGHLLRSRPVERKVALVNRSGALAEGRARFLARELAGRREVRPYLPRGATFPVLVRHGTADVATLDDVFLTGDYAPPPPVRAILDAARPLRVLDLGANVGYFGAYLLGRYPDAEILALEPDPDNAACLRRAIELSGRAAQWRVREVAAAASDGDVRFVAGRTSTSHVAEPGEEGGTIAVPAIDVLPEMARADLVKIDVEGGEWEILADPRLADAGGAIVVEYHPERCPGLDPESVARRLLGAAGYEVETTITRTGHQGVVWGWRE